MNADNNPPGRILVVDDDPTVADVVARYLTRDGHAVTCVADGNEALDRAAEQDPDLVVLDLMLPGIDGLEVCRRLRQRSPVPVIMLTALGAETDRLVGLETGADDYVTKPFSPRELALRVRSVLRRARGGLASRAIGADARGHERLRDGDLTVDVGAHEVRKGGVPVSLTTREFDLLVFLMRHPRQVFSRTDLLERVWGWTFGDSSTVTVHVRRLREKVEDDPTCPRQIVTVWGVGYRFEPAADGSGGAPGGAGAPSEATSGGASGSASGGATDGPSRSGSGGPCRSGSGGPSRSASGSGPGGPPGERHDHPGGPA